jgi:hypothetical protein
MQGRARSDPPPWPEDGGGGDLVGGFGLRGEAVGQAGARQDEAVGNQRTEAVN